MEQNKNVQESTEQLHGVIGLMDRMSDFIKKHGLKGTFTSLLTLFIAAAVGFVIFNPGEVFEQFQEYNEKKHEEGIKQRIEADPEIRALLTQFRVENGAERAYILEAHNGGTNLTNLPFLYADLTYLDPRGKFDYIEYEYKNFRLSRYPWASYVMDKGVWFGPIEDCKESDPELYYRLQKENVAYMGMYVMYGKSGLPSACLGIIFGEEDKEIDVEKVLKSMHVYSSLINPYLIY